jgi:hypothetical protein
MTDRTILSPNGRATTPPAKAIGVSGVVTYGGVIYWQDMERAWTSTERDRTIQTMLNDPLIGSILFGIEALVRRVDWNVQAADESTAAQEQAEFVQSCLEDMDGQWPGDTLAQVLTFLGWGWSCLEMTYKRRSGITGTPSSRHDDGRIGWKRWALRPQNTRYGWDFEGDDPVALIQQDPQNWGERYTIPLDKCLLFKYTSRDNSPEGTTPLRVAYKAWYYKEKLQKYEAIGVERDLAGMPVMKIPSSDIVAQNEVYQAAQQIVTGIRNDSQSGVVISSERDDAGNLVQELDLLSTGGTRSFDTDVIVRRYANEIVTTFLANVMRTGQDGIGSYALADVQGGFFQQAIGAHLDTIAQIINEQAILPLIRFNGFDDQLAPMLVHGDIESADLARLGQYIVNLSTAGVLLKDPELLAFVHEVAGLPVPSVEEIEQELAEKEAAAEQMRQQIAAGQTNQEEGEDEEEQTPGRQFTEPYSDDLLERARRAWNELAPDRWRGVLEAEVA